MHRLTLATTTVLLASLENGQLFIANFGDGHGHQTGVIFDRQGVLILSGPDRMKALQRRRFDRAQVVVCDHARALSLRVPSGVTTPHRQTPSLGRLVIDDEGTHLTCAWSTDGAGDELPAFFSVDLNTWEHGDVRSGVEIDAWALVCTGADGQEVSVVEWPGVSGPAS